MTSLSKPTTTLLLREALYQTISCSAQELRDAVGQILVATADELPPGSKAGPSDRSVYDAETRTMVLLADRIPAGQEALVIAQEIGLWHGQAAAEAVCAASTSTRSTPPAAGPGASQLTDAGWVPADGYTKDLFPGATFMRTIGGAGTPFASYDFTIAQGEGGTWVPIHGSVKMNPVASASEAADRLLDYWHDLPLGEKRRVFDPIDMVRESWRVEEWLAHALPPGVSTRWSVYDQKGEEIGRAETRQKALEKAWLSPANQDPTLAQNEENEKLALQLRRQALELLKQAHTLDRLNPYVVRHETRWAEDELLVWAATCPSEEEAKKRVGYQEWQDEKVYVQETFPLEQLTGADLSTRWDKAEAKAQSQDSRAVPSIG